MNEHLKAFLDLPALNRNASPHTVRAYDSDLSQFLDLLSPPSRRVKPHRIWRPAALDQHAIRGFLGDLHARGNSRATAARKLAAVRTFLRYLRREELIDDDPAALVATPKRELRMPAHLCEDGDDRACSRCRDVIDSRSAGATARSSSCSTRRGCA